MSDTTAYTTISNNGTDDRLKVWSCTHNDKAIQATPGTIIDVTKKSIIVACGKGSVALTTIQMPGKKAMPTSAILNSRRELFSEGTLLGQ